MKPQIKAIYLLRAFLIILVIELILTPFLHTLFLDNRYYEAFANILLLTLLSFPLLKYFVISPIVKELETRCQKTQKKLVDADAEREIAGKLEEELIKSMEFQNSYTRAIFDGVKNIIIATDGEHIQEANRAFFTFFPEYETLEAFKKEHDCICDFFEKIDEEGFVYKDIGGEIWCEYILKRPQVQHKVAIRRGAEQVILSVDATRVLFENSDLVIVSFYDITTLEHYNKELETMVEEKTAELQNSIATLRENEAKLQAITDSAHDAIVLLDDKGELSFMNPSAKKLLGYEAKELAGRNFHEVIAPPEYLDAYRQGYAHFVKTGEGNAIGRTLELTAVNKDGIRIPVSLSISGVKLDGRWHGVGLLHDITERKKYETALLESKNRLEAAIRTSGVGIYDYTIPLDERAYWSDEWAGIFGYSKEELPSWDKMIAWLTERTHPEDKAVFLENLEALFNEGLSYSVKKRIRHKEGRWITVSSIAKVVEWDTDGRPKRAIGAIQDITESVSLYNELELNRQRYQDLVEDINDWIWEVDAEGNFRYSSPKVKELLGYEPDELIGIGPFSLMPEQERERLEGMLMKLVKAGAPFESIENTLRRKDGRFITVETSAQAIRDRAGNVTGYRGINRDITDRKKLEEELRHKEELMLAQSRQAAMGDMIAMIAHQWRQPITVVGMAINNLQLPLALGNEVSKELLEKTINTVSHQLKHLSKTIDDFRNFFKPNKQKERVQPKHILDDAMQIIGKSLENNDIKVVYTHLSEQTVSTFPNELLQVYLNLLANAKDVLKEGKVKDPLITISIDGGEGQLKTHICDNGGGIPPEIIDRLGEPYLTTKEENGTGLGLYMSKIIVEKHMGGRILWENSDGGACFTVCLPLEQAST